MGKEGLAKKIGRIRPPRVQITYDVETGDAIEKREIPFVVGVMADLSGQPEQPLPSLKDGMKEGSRRFVEIDKDNFDNVLKKVNPRLAFKVDNKLSEDDTRLGVELKFKSMADFEPTAVAKQIPALRDLLEARAALHNLRSTLMGNDKLEKLLQDVLTNHESLKRIAAESGSQAGEKKEG